jgi:hypothetical protein
LRDKNPGKSPGIISLCETRGALVCHALLEVARRVRLPSWGRNILKRTLKIAPRAIVCFASNGAVIIIALAATIIAALFYVDTLDTRTSGCPRGSIENVFSSCTPHRLPTLP